jgi:beta-fructofuranosidase
LTRVYGGRVIFTTPFPGAAFPTGPAETGPFFLEPGEPVKLRIFIDRSVMEVFVNSRQCIAVRVYPGRKDSTSVSIRAQGGPAEVIKIDAWELKTIYY